MSEDILERAKDAAENIDHYAYDCDFEEARLVILALIPEVERLRADQDAIMAAWDKDAVEKDARVQELEAERERLQSNWRQEHATAEIWKEDFRKMKKALQESELLRQAQYNQITANNARIKELEAEVEAKNKQIKELQDIIDKPPEDADWVADYHLLQSALDGPIIDAARKWHAAYRKAQNSNLMRAKEVERLRSQSVDQVFRAKNEEISAQAARIKELSELNDGFMGNCNNLRSRCWRLEEENKRLSEAFLENQAEIEYYISQNRHFVKLWKYTDEVNKIDIRKKIEIKAREELDRIKEGGKDEQL